MKKKLILIIIILLVVVLVVVGSFKYINIKKNEEVFKVTYEYIYEKLGQDYCNKYIKLNSQQRFTSADGEAYYLSYDVSIPEKQIFSSFHIIIGSDLSKPKEIDLLPNCKLEKECEFISRNEILKVAQSNADKFGYRVTVDDMVLKFEKYGPKSPSIWLIAYKLSQNNALECTKFKMGATVYLEINALNKEIISEQKNCNTPVMN